MRNSRELMRTMPLAIVWSLLSSPFATRAADDGWELTTLAGPAVLIELRDGSVVRGVVVGFPPGHVTVSVGAAKVTVPWELIARFRLDPNPPTGAKTSGTSAPTSPEIVAATPSPPRPPRATETVPNLPGEAPDPPRERPLGIGVRVKLLTPHGHVRFPRGSESIQSFAGVGAGFDLSLSLRMAGALSMRAAYEYAEFLPGPRNASAVTAVASDAVEIGMRARLDAHGVFELGAVYRWLRVPYASGAAPDDAPRRIGRGAALFEGAALRSALGITSAEGERVRLELLIEAAVGRFERFSEKNASTGTVTLVDSARTTHAFVGISAGVAVGP